MHTMNIITMTQSKMIDLAVRFTPSTKVLPTFSQMARIVSMYHLIFSMRVTKVLMCGSQWKRERTGCSQEADALNR